MVDAPWYALHHLPVTRPKAQVVVRLRWGAWNGVAAGAWDNRARLWRWAARGADGVAETLPPASSWGDTWPDEPHSWQPLDPATFWTERLPPPPPMRELVRPRLVSEALGPLDAPAPIGEEPPAPVGPWWLDPHALTYSAPGAISREEAEGRLSRAMLTDGLSLMRLPGIKSGVAGMVADTLTSADADEIPRFEPSPRDISDCTRVMAWFAGLNPPQLRPKRRPGADVEPYNAEQRLLAWRVVPRMALSWAEIAEELNRTEGEARHAHALAMARVWRLANGETQVFEHVTVIDQLAMLRERNRQHKRQTA